jgi:hypothetical protein
MSSQPAEHVQPATPGPMPWDAPPEQAKEPKAGRGGNGWAIVIAVAVLALIGFIATRSTHTDATPADQKADAARACEKTFIPPRLKSPATAQFSAVSTVVDGETYKVAGQVDSQNAFGALVRASFTCEMHDGGDKWVLDSANVTG